MLTAAGDQGRPPYAVGRSMCQRTVDFQPYDTYPIRSPLVVADFLLPHVRGRTYAEIGTQSGDLLACLQHYAKSVTAVERMYTQCRKLRERGIHVVCKDLKMDTILAAEARNQSIVPIADVYYWWLHPGDNKPILGFVTRELERRRLSARVFFGMDPHTDPLRHFEGQAAWLKSLAPESREARAWLRETRGKCPRAWR